MEQYFEMGPPPPKNEAEKIGEALYNALQKQFPITDNWVHAYIANGDPRSVQIRFYPNENTEKFKGTREWEEFPEVTQNIIDSYDIPSDIHFAFEEGADGHIIKISIVNK